MEYRIIDADSHLNEPGNVWQDRVPAALKDRAPKMLDIGDGKIAWSFDGGKRVSPVAMSATAGVDPTQYDTSGTPNIRPGSYDPHARLEEMEYDMVQAQLLYPSVALTGAHQYSQDPELQLACVRAYNDWLREDFCSVSPERLIGLPLGPMTGIEDLILEWRRVADQGAKGLIMSTYPNGGADPSVEDDRFWSEVEEWDYPMHIHFGFVGAARGGLPSGGAAPQGVARFTAAFLSRIGANIYKPLCDILANGLFERHPKLKVVAVETGIGWIPFYLESMDDLFFRSRFHTGVHLKMLPSEYFKEHIWATFITDPVGVDLRHMIGVDHIMWSTDYPHVASDWPNSQRTAAYEFRHVPEAEKRKMMRDNAANLYKLG